MLDSAVRNNAAWCEAVCRAQNIAARWASSHWMTDLSPPPLYPDLITLVPDAREIQINAISQIARMRDTWSVKDSYASLDLSGFGANVIFDAQWQVHPHESGSPPEDVTIVRSELELREWEEHWRSDPKLPRIFCPSLLQDHNAVFLAVRRGGSVVAGAALYAAHGACGLTNLFGAHDDMERVIAAASRNATYLPILCYTQQRLQGFAPIGPLRVWIYNSGEYNA